MRFIYSLLFALSLFSTPVEARVKVLCAVGDSLVAGGPILSGNPGWPSILQTRRIGQRFGIVNAGIGGYTASQALSLFNSDLKGKGCTHLAVLVCTNDLAGSAAATTCFATLEAIVASAREDTIGDPNGISVTVYTPPARGGSASWDGTKETQRLALRTLILAMSADATVDLESMGCSGSPIEMCAAFRAADLLHLNGTPGTGGTPEVADLTDAAVSW